VEAAGLALLDSVPDDVFVSDFVSGLVSVFFSAVVSDGAASPAELLLFDA
jgi:hypothetical protein